MSAEQIPLIGLGCAECAPSGCRRTRSDGGAYLTDDEPADVAFYCPECVEREFGTDS